MIKGKMRCLTKKWKELRNSFSSHSELEERFGVKLAITRWGRYETILYLECPGGEYFDLMKNVGGPWRWEPVNE